MKIVRLTITAVLLLMLHTALAQHLNGIWKGTLTQGAGGCFPTYNVEVQINGSNLQALTGASYHYSDVTNYVKKSYTGNYNTETKVLNLQEQKVLTFHIPVDCTPCIRYYTLSYSREGPEETLSGTWGGVQMNGSAVCPPGKIMLHRIAHSEFDHIQEIMVDTGKLKLEFYDNAQIDGDSITVTVNNVVVASHQLLGLKPIQVEIKIDPQHPEQEVTMVAENLGSIPPNTAILVVTAGEKKFRLFLSSDKKKNAQVRFIYQPPQPSKTGL